MTERLKVILREAGFSDKEADVYLAAIKLGETTAPEIAKESGLVRATAHGIIDALELKGVIATRQHPDRKRAKLYKAVSPNAVLDKQRSVVDQLQSALPELLNLNPESFAVPQVQTYYGVEGIGKVWDESLNHGDEILTILTKDLVAGMESWGGEKEDYTPEQVHSYAKKRAAKGIWIRGIFPYEPNKKKAKELDLWDTQRAYLNYKATGRNTLREYYALPVESFPFEAEIMIFGDRMSITNYFDGSAAIIRNRQMIESLKLLYQAGFNHAKANEDKILSSADKDYIRSYAAETDTEPS